MEQVIRNPDLHAAVLAAPDDDVPRLVYADWLMEQGDPRGELIALQVERATLHAVNPRAAQLMGREQALMLTHYATWQARLPQPCSFAFARGFVEKLSCRHQALTAKSLEDTCVRELQLDGGEGLVRHVAPLFPAMALRTLEIRREVQPSELGRLSTGHLRGLRTLRLLGAQTTTAHVAALQASSLRAVPELEIEHLHGDGFRLLGQGAPLRRLVANGSHLHGWLGSLRDPGFAALECLDLRNTSLRADDALAVVDAGLPLVELDLSWNRLDATAAWRIAHDPRMRSLRRLGLAYTYIGREGLAALVASANLGRIELVIDGDVLGMRRDYSQSVEAWHYPIPEPYASRFRVVLVGATTR